MLSADSSKEALRKFFEKRRVGQLFDLFAVLQTGSRMSVFRRLSSLGYRSSFTHAGRYYTLAEVPEFDAWGLWFHQQVGFSRAGTLKATVLQLINDSPTGMTPKELRALLKLPASNALYNTLRDLTGSSSVQARRQGGRSVYLDASPQVAAEKMAQREAQRTQVPTPPEATSAETVIAVLVEALRAGEVLAEATLISSRLDARSISVSSAKVDSIFAHYGLQPGKKTARRC